MSSQNPSFTGQSPQLLTLPTSSPEGLASVRVCPPAAPVPIAPAGAAGIADASSFQSVQAVVYDCKDTFLGDDVARNPQRYPVRVNDGISRFWLYLDSTEADYSQTQTSVGVPITPDPFEIQVRVASGLVSETIFQGIVTPSSYKDNGLIVGLDGYLGSQYEVWGRVPNVGGTAFPLMVKFRIHVDRLAAAARPPTLGRLTTNVAIQYYP